MRTYLCGRLSLRQLHNSRPQLLDIEFGRDFPFGELSQLFFLLLDQLVRVPERSAVEAQLSLHSADRLLVLLDHGAYDFLVFAHPRNGTRRRGPMMLAMLLAEPVELFIAGHVLLPEILVVILELVEIRKHLL